MPRYVIEREIPGAGNLSAEELHGISQTSCGVLQELGPQIQWLHSYVTGDKMARDYVAALAEEEKPSEELVEKADAELKKLLDES